MYVFISLVSAILYGAADFIGGLATRRAHAIAVVIYSQFAGLVVLAIAVQMLPEARYVRSDLAWGAVAGAAGSAGVGLLYQALAIGTMGVVAPTTAVCAVTMSVVAGLVFGERPSAIALSGIALAIVAIVLVSRPPSLPGADRSPVRAGIHLPPGMGHALLSGVAIGVFYLTLSRSNSEAGLWPLVAARATSVACFMLIAVAVRQSIRLDRRVVPMAASAGVLDMLANVLYLVATRQGPLTIVVTLASLYPASTVVLARVVLGERLSRVQQAGIVLAMVAVSLIVGGR